MPPRAAQPNEPDEELDLLKSVTDGYKEKHQEFMEAPRVTKAFGWREMVMDGFSRETVLPPQYGLNAVSMLGRELELGVWTIMIGQTEFRWDYAAAVDSALSITITWLSEPKSAGSACRIIATVFLRLWFARKLTGRVLYAFKAVNSPTLAE